VQADTPRSVTGSMDDGQSFFSEVNDLIIFKEIIWWGERIAFEIAVIIGALISFLIEKEILGMNENRKIKV